MHAVDRPRQLPRLLAALLLLGPASLPAAGERLYQWQDARSGHTQLSGRPPGWYRSASAVGPRVLVFADGRLVDDTALAVSEALRQLLREEARLSAAPAPASASGALAAAPNAAAGAEAAAEEDEAQPALEAGASEQEGPSAGPVVTDPRQQALDVIERFDRARVAAAKAVVEALLPTEDTEQVLQNPAPQPEGEGVSPASPKP